MDADFAVIGSGFGGSASALRLAEAGFSVTVFERGKRFATDDFPKTNWDLRRYLWAPAARCFGIQAMTLFRNVFVLGGSGVGGGSLVYANTLLQPGREFFEAEQWKGLADWEAELVPKYEIARKMMGVATNPRLTFVDEVLKDCAKELGRESTFAPSEVGVYFGEPEKTVPDPYFGGKGPARTGCRFCGGCMVGCRYDSKNTLDKNYLYLAEKAGARVVPETRVTDIRPLDGGGYELVVESSTAWLKAPTRSAFRARRVIVAAGVIGTLRLLLRCKHETGSLPLLSGELGRGVRTNSEALLGVTATDSPPERDFSHGIAISSIFHADEHTHVEPVRYPPGSSLMRLLAVPLADGENPLLRTLRMIAEAALHPLRWLKIALNRRWPETTVIFLVMQTIDSRMRVGWGRGLFTGFMKGLVSRGDDSDAGGTAGKARPVPVFNPLAHRIARSFARRVGGLPQNSVNEVTLGIPTTAHFLGGCVIGRDAASGVVDANQEVFGYPGLYVCDGSAIPANLGVNPSLTILAMTERAVERMIARLIDRP